MKLVKLFLLLLMFPAILFAESPDMNGDGGAYDLKKSFSDMTVMQEFLCKRAFKYGSKRQIKDACFDFVNVTIQGFESGRVISNDHTTKEARLAEAVGFGRFCNRSSSSLSLIKHKDKLYLLGAAHSFYKNGNLRCNDTVGTFYPDRQLKGNSTADPHFEYQFKLPPLNHEIALKYHEALHSNKRLNDFVIFELTDKAQEGIRFNQFQQKRTFLTLARMKTYEIIDYSINNQVTMISSRNNFHKRKKVSIQEGCEFSEILTTSLILHDCDTGGGSSGAPLISSEHDGKYYSLGSHFAGVETQINDRPVGNYFIPSNYILDTLESIIGIDKDNIALEDKLSEILVAEQINTIRNNKLGRDLATLETQAKDRPLIANYVISSNDILDTLETIKGRNQDKILLEDKVSDINITRANSLDRRIAALEREIKDNPFDNNFTSSNDILDTFESIKVVDQGNTSFEDELNDINIVKQLEKTFQSLLKE